MANVGVISENFPMRTHVILPLYSMKSGVKAVPPKSGINQWNAGGRRRRFGESYIPVPSFVRKNNPTFFPSRDASFNLLLPNGKLVLASLCQADGKALMSNPNDALCDWLFKVIDSDYGTDAWKVRLSTSIPYTYEDLLKIEKDSVRVTKTDINLYEIEFSPIGAYEDYLRAFEI